MILFRPAVVLVLDGIGAHAEFAVVVERVERGGKLGGDRFVLCENGAASDKHLAAFEFEARCVAAVIVVWIARLWPKLFGDVVDGVRIGKKPDGVGFVGGKKERAARIVMLFVLELLCAHAEGKVG